MFILYFQENNVSSSTNADINDELKNSNLSNNLSIDVSKSMHNTSHKSDIQNNKSNTPSSNIIVRKIFLNTHILLNIILLTSNYNFRIVNHNH